MAIAEMNRSTTIDAIPGSTTMMKALVYHGPGNRAWEEKPRPVIEKPTDAVVRITTTTICGTDLHILKGDLPAVTDGRIVGTVAGSWATRSTGRRRSTYAFLTPTEVSTRSPPAATRRPWSCSATSCRRVSSVAS